MFTIIPYGRGAILKSEASGAEDLLTSVVPDEQLCPSAERPFVQLSHQEVPAQDVEQVLGYAGITASNSPIGLPCDFEPRKLGRNCLLFPLRHLEAHVRRAHPGLIAEYERHSSFEKFLDSREMPARDYLVAGLLECIKWCFQNRAPLTIRW
jgi:hypothetical protein